MDGERFDSIVRRLARVAPRRRAIRVLAGGALAAVVGPGRRRAAGQEIGAETCRERLDNCDRRDQCCEAEEGHRLGCARVSEHCRRARHFPGERCCGRAGARCGDDCSCCRGFACLDGRCRPSERTCLETVCCGCYRCTGNDCEQIRCVTAPTFRQCLDRCPNADLIDGVGGRGTTFACRPGGGCKVTCEDLPGHAAPQRVVLKGTPPR